MLWRSISEMSVSISDADTAMYSWRNFFRVVFSNRCGQPLVVMTSHGSCTISVSPFSERCCIFGELF
jgi:hypothetical protein